MRGSGRSSRPCTLNSDSTCSASLVYRRQVATFAVQALLWLNKQAVWCSTCSPMLYRLCRSSHCYTGDLECSRTLQRSCVWCSPPMHCNATGSVLLPVHTRRIAHTCRLACRACSSCTPRWASRALCQPVAASGMVCSGKVGQYWPV